MIQKNYSKEIEELRQENETIRQAVQILGKACLIAVRRNPDRDNILKALKMVS